MHMRGFTLVELLTVMTISAILIAAAIPSFQWVIARNRVSDASNALQSHLQYARMEAHRRNNTVSVCRVDDPNANPPVCSGAIVGTVDGNDWASGWVVFEKSGGANAAIWEGGDTVLMRQPAMTVGGARVQIHTNLALQRIAYQPLNAGGVIGSGTLAIDYGTPPAAVATRALGSITLTDAGRCVVIGLPLGTMRPSQAVAGVCP